MTEHRKDGAAVRAWLFLLCVLVFAMIMVGGATRLTDSGLSITEWQPIIGMVPPLGDADWQEAFAKYKEIPEYQVVNRGMSLEEFKFIYWWEWAHRFLGRIIGFAFLFPFLFFLWRGRISSTLRPKLIVMFVLGGLQGALGWYMVKSGLVDRVDVSQYRLAAHLCLAVLIFGYIFWVAWRLNDDREAPSNAGSARISAVGLVIAVFIQIGLGAFVAGLDAGQGYNTWPLMDGAFIPEGLGAMSPWYVNLFENALTVQFNHRMFAYGLILWGILHCVLLVSGLRPRTIPLTGFLLLLAIWGQVALGIITLLAVVPISLGLAHQAMAIVVFAVSLIHLSSLMPGPVRDRR